MKTQLHNCYVYAEGLGLSHTLWLASSVSLHSYGPRLVDYVCFLVVSLTALGSIILTPTVQQGSSSSV